ncbi:MAG: CAP domain-containing protein [Desulfobulbaceae bacterium]|nr:CAP domain-containing protein [Desulfobulbaceae bacterium]
MQKHKLLISISALAAILICNFAYSAENAAEPALEEMLIQTINQARSNPWADAARLGIDPDILRETVVPEETAAEWDKGMKPLIRNEILDQVADAHCREMISSNNYSQRTSNGQSTTERIEEAGYSASFANEAVGAVAFDFFIEDNQAGRQILDALFSRALKLDTPNGAALLHESAVEVGIALRGGIVSIQGFQFNVYVLSVVVARPAMENIYTIQCGHVYDDTNDNNEYDAGEGINGVTISRFGREQLAVTGIDGGYCLRQPSDEWIIQICAAYRKQHNTYAEYEDDFSSVIKRDYSARTFQCRQQVSE